MIAFGELEINNEEKCKIPYIIMNKYEKSLKKYRDTVSPSFNDVKRLLKTMLFSVESLHNKGILHRDIKPENILMDSEGNFLMADFGIASFDEERFPLDYKTKASSRMANASFSAPEQIDHSAKTTVASDIYSIGQIIYWFVFNRLKKGSDNACLSECFKGEKEASIIDAIIRRCMRNLPTERFQSIQEIRFFWKEELDKSKEINPFDDMYKFQESILSVYPECYNSIKCIENQDTISKLFHSIMKPSYDRKIWFNDGRANNEIEWINKINDCDYLINFCLHTINKVWCYTSSDYYNDLILIDRKTPEPFVINGEKYYTILKVNDKIYPGNTIDSGYIRLENGDVKKIRELSDCYEMSLGEYHRYIAVAPHSNLLIYDENDEVLSSLSSGEISEELLFKFIHNLKKSREIYMSL